MWLSKYCISEVDENQKSNLKRKEKHCFFNAIVETKWTVDVKLFIMGNVSIGLCLWHKNFIIYSTHTNIDPFSHRK